MSREDADFLRELAKSEVWEVSRIADAPERLREIADKISFMADATFLPSQALEGRAEAKLVEYVECALDNPDENSEPYERERMNIALWLLYRALKSAGTKSLIGNGLGVLGAALMGGAITGAKK